MSPKRHLQSQGKEIIAKVYHRMKYEAENGVEKLTDARWRTAQAVGVSESTITRILQEEKQASTSKETFFKSPFKPKRFRPKSRLDEFDMAILRSTIATFHIEFKELPTLRKLKQILIEKIGFNGCLETLRTILKESGYEWSKIDDRHKILVEKHDIQMLRYLYLKQLKKYRDEGRYIVFTGKEISPLQKKIAKGMRVMIAHAGGCEGFVPNANLIYEENSTSGNQDIMNLDRYKKWLSNQLLPNLPKNTVIIMDKYPNALLENPPNTNSNKHDMQKWLDEKNIPFEETMKKIELYDLILRHKDKKRFVIDELIRSEGFEFLPLPPHHPELNPIEEVWGILKNYVAKSISQDLTSITASINELIETIDRSMWAKICSHVEETEKQYLQYFDMDNELIIHNDSDSEEDGLLIMR